MFGDDLNGPLYFSLEIEPKTRRSFFIIRYGLPKLYFCFMEDRYVSHVYLALISEKTSAAGRPEAVPSRTMSNRR